MFVHKKILEAVLYLYQPNKSQATYSMIPSILLGQFSFLKTSQLDKLHPLSLSLYPENQNQINIFRRKTILLLKYSQLHKKKEKRITQVTLLLHKIIYQYEFQRSFLLKKKKINKKHNFFFVSTESSIQQCLNLYFTFMAENFRD